MQGHSVPYRNCRKNVVFEEGLFALRPENHGVTCHISGDSSRNTLHQLLSWKLK
jgi:hypothetical protein